jgi:hypothetical protein
VHPYTVLHILQQCPYYDEEFQTFYLHGAMNNILGDYRCNVSNFFTFFHAIEVGKYI